MRCCTYFHWQTYSSHTFSSAKPLHVSFTRTTLQNSKLTPTQKPGPGNLISECQNLRDNRECSFPSAGILHFLRQLPRCPRYTDKAPEIQTEFTSQKDTITCPSSLCTLWLELFPKRADMLLDRDSQAGEEFLLRFEFHPSLFKFQSRRLSLFSCAALFLTSVSGSKSGRKRKKKMKNKRDHIFWGKSFKWQDDYFPHEFFIRKSDDSICSYLP